MKTILVVLLLAVATGCHGFFGAGMKCEVPPKCDDPEDECVSIALPADGCATCICEPKNRFRPDAPILNVLECPAPKCQDPKHECFKKLIRPEDNCVICACRTKTEPGVAHSFKPSRMGCGDPKCQDPKSECSDHVYPEGEGCPTCSCTPTTNPDFNTLTDRKNPFGCPAPKCEDPKDECFKYTIHEGSCIICSCRSKTEPHTFKPSSMGCGFAKCEDPKSECSQLNFPEGEGCPTCSCRPKSVIPKPDINSQPGRPIKTDYKRR